jgi:hypothetical protein
MAFLKAETRRWLFFIANMWYSIDNYWLFITIITVDHRGDLMSNGDCGSSNSISLHNAI